MPRRTTIAGRLSVLLIAGCLGTDTSSKSRDTLTQRQKDSLLGNSTTIPNAAAVKKAQTAADSANARGAGIDTTTER
jgi:hypothetical protein